MSKCVASAKEKITLWEKQAQGGGSHLPQLAEGEEKRRARWEALRLLVGYIYHQWHWYMVQLIELVTQLPTSTVLYVWLWYSIVSSYHLLQCWEEDMCTVLSGSRYEPVQTADWCRISLWWSVLCDLKDKDRRDTETVKCSINKTIYSTKIMNLYFTDME